MLFVAAEKDELCPTDIIRKAAAEAPNAKLSIHDSTHFDIYMGENLQVRNRERVWTVALTTLYLAGSAEMDKLRN